MDSLLPPEEATEFLAAPRTRLDVERFLEQDAFEGGFMLVGPQGQGKATLAYMLAATILSGGRALGEIDPKVRSLMVAGSHPDLRVLRRTENEKTGKLRGEIEVDAVRALIGKMHQTSATGRSVVIVDLADELGRSASNALLKLLEEPPKGACLLLLSRSTSRLLPTLVSRCRRIALRAVDDEAITAWLLAKGVTIEEAQKAARNAAGAPGKALRLALGEGQDASAMAESFLRAVSGKQDLLAASRKFSAKNGELVAEEARDIVLTRLRRALTEEGVEPAELSRRFAAYDRARETFEYAGTADPAQTAFVAGLAIRDALAGKGGHVR